MFVKRTQTHLVPRVPVEPPGEVELEQRHLNRAGRSARQADDLVDRYRRRAEQALDRASTSSPSTFLGL